MPGSPPRSLQSGAASVGGERVSRGRSPAARAHKVSMNCKRERSSSMASHSDSVSPADAVDRRMPMHVQDLPVLIRDLRVDAPASPDLDRSAPDRARRRRSWAHARAAAAAGEPAGALAEQLLGALARPASFPQAAARLLASALDAPVALFAVSGGPAPADGPGPRSALVASASPAGPEACLPAGAAAALDPAIPQLLASGEALPFDLGAPAGPPGSRWYLYPTSPADGAGSDPAPPAVIAVQLVPGAGEPSAAARGALAEAARLVATGLAAAASCPVEAIARRVRNAADPSRFDGTAEAARAALAADRCLVLESCGSGSGGGGWCVRGAAPADARALPAELSDAMLPELAARRSLSVAAADGAAVVAEPIVAGGRLVGALVACRRARPWDASDADTLASCRPRPAPPSPRPPPLKLARPATPQRQLRERDLIRRLSNELSACSGVQAAFDCCAELLCGLFDATRAYLFDIAREHGGSPRARYAVPGTPHADEVISMDSYLVDMTLQACDASRDGVYVRHGLEALHPDFREFATALSCMCAASKRDGAVSALLIVEATDKVAQWGAEDTRFMRLIADQIAVALGQSALREQIAAQNRDLQREVRNSGLLAGIVREISQEVDGSIEKIYRRSVELVGKAFEVDRCSLWEYFDDSYEAAIKPPEVVWVRHPGICKELEGYDAEATKKWWHMLNSCPDQVLHIGDVQTMAREAFGWREDVRRKVQAAASRSSMSTPALFRGQVQGLLVVEMVEGEAAWGPDERRLLRHVADHVAVAIAHGRLLQQQREHAAQLERQLMHSGLLGAIHQVLGVTEVFHRSARLVREALRASRVGVWSLEQADLSAVDVDPGLPGAPRLDAPVVAAAAASFETLCPIFREIASKKRVFAITDLHDAGSPEWAPIPEAHRGPVRDMLLGLGIQSICFVFACFRGSANSLVTVCQLDWARRWEEDELSLLHTVSDQIGAAIMQSRLLSKETEQRELLAKQNVALEEARREADAASTAKSQFLAMVSHEIRTPLNALCNMSEFLLDTELTPQQRDFSTVIHSSSVALLNILKDILDTSRIEFNKVEICRAPVDLVDAVERTVELMFPSAVQKGIDLTWHVSRGCPAVLETDGARLNQVLVNLIGNGIKFTSKGEVSVTAEVAGAALRIVIRDTGIGISPDNQSKLFSWFYQVDSGNSRQYSGTGLGLFISRKLAVLLGGDLSVESELGRGSAFIVTLPLDALGLGPAGGPPGPPPALAPPSPPRRPPLAGRRVAVWSPSPATRALLVDALEGAGAQALALPELHAEVGAAVECCVLDTAGLPIGPDGGFLVPGALAGVPRVALAPRGGAGLTEALQGCAEVVLKPVLPRAAVDAVAAALARPAARPASSPECAGPAGPAGSGLAPRATPPARVSPTAAAARDGRGGGGEGARPGVDPAHPHRRGRRRARARPPAPSKRAPCEPASRSPRAQVNTKILLLMLRKKGYVRVDAVTNGAEALAAVRAGAASALPYQCLLLDVMMPVMDGLAAARRICAELPPERRPYMIALTASAMAGDREKCLAAGMHDYLSKPVRLDDLVAALRRCEAVAPAPGEGPGAGAAAGPAAMAE
eukprot:tig00021137_g18985.t1